MAKPILHKNKDGILIKLPKEWQDVESLIFNDVIIIFNKANKDKANEEGEFNLDEKQKELLWRVSLLNYNKRTLSNIKNQFGIDAYNLIKTLIKQGVLKYKKNNNNIFIIYPDKLYDEMKKETKKLYSKQNEVFSTDYAILNEEEFKHLANPHDYLAIKSFDGNFYVIKKELYMSLAKKVLNKLGSQIHIEDLASELHLDVKLVKIILHILAENGLVYEVKKGVFAKV